MDGILNDLSDFFERIVLVPARERIKPIRRSFEDVLQSVGVNIGAEYIELLLVGFFIGAAILTYKLFYGHITIASILWFPFQLLGKVAFLPFKVLGSLIFKDSIKVAAPLVHHFSESCCNVTVVISECS
uniref:Uncharacterized protein n=1 Tax=Aplanochytrium stocchinoi TaxID=215587 RepID=A0A7S3LMB0_9STRA